MQYRWLMGCAAIGAALTGGAYVFVVMGVGGEIPTVIENALRSITHLLVIITAMAWLAGNILTRLEKRIDAQTSDLRKALFDAIAESATTRFPAMVPMSMDAGPIRKAIREEAENVIRVAADKAVRSDLVARATAPVHYRNGTDGVPMATVLPFTFPDE